MEKYLGSNDYICRTILKERAYWRFFGHFTACQLSISSLLPSTAVLQDVGTAQKDKPGVFAYLDLPGPLSRGTMKLGTTLTGYKCRGSIAGFVAGFSYSLGERAVVT